MMEVKEWMALENDTGHPTIVLTDPKSGEIVAKPRISVFSKQAVGAVNLVAPARSKDGRELAIRFKAQLRAERVTIEEAYEAALELDDDAPAPELLDSDAFEDAYLPAEPGEWPEETEPDEIPSPAPKIEIVKEPEPPVIQATEAAVKLAEEAGLDLASIEGSGAEGAIIKSDVEAALKAEAEKPDAEEKAEAEKADAKSSEGRSHG